jgi:hypothetical protein
MRFAHLKRILRLGRFRLRDPPGAQDQFTLAAIAQNPRQHLHEEVGCTHPGLDRTGGVLDRFAPLAHLLGMPVEPPLNRLENMLLLPSGDPRCSPVVQLCLWLGKFTAAVHLNTVAWPP